MTSTRPSSKTTNIWQLEDGLKVILVTDDDNSLVCYPLYNPSNALVSLHCSVLKTKLHSNIWQTNLLNHSKRNMSYSKTKYCNSCINEWVFNGIIAHILFIGISIWEMGRNKTKTEQNVWIHVLYYQTRWIEHWHYYWYMLITPNVYWPCDSI